MGCQVKLGSAGCYHSLTTPKFVYSTLYFIHYLLCSAVLNDGILFLYHIHIVSNERSNFNRRTWQGVASESTPLSQSQALTDLKPEIDKVRPREQEIQSPK